MNVDEGLIYRFSAVTQEKGSKKAGTLIDASVRINMDKGWDLLGKFPIVMDSLEAIATANGMDPRDPRVAHAYIIGSNLLDAGIDVAKFRDLVVARFCGEGKKYAIPDLVPAIPEGTPLTHNAWVGAYGLASKPGATREEIAACRVLPAVALPRLEAVALFGEGIRTEFLGPFGLNPGQGETVALHRGSIIAKLDAEETQANLLKYGFPELVT